MYTPNALLKSCRQSTASRWMLSLFLALAVTACDDDDMSSDTDALGMGDVDAGMLPPIDMDADPPSDGGNTDGAPTVEQELPPQGMAILLSNFQAISLSLLNPATLVVEKNRCVDSQIHMPGLTQTFSGDTVLASQRQPGGRVLLIDRANATLTWVNPQSCAVVRQINVSTGFFANPHDALVLGDRIYVTRYESNPAPTADPGDFDEGSDVLVLDRQTGTPVARIDLRGHATMAAGTVLPRPDRLMASGGRILVSLNNIGPNFAADEIGPGRIVVIDPATNTVVDTLDPPGLDNCVGMTLAPGGVGLVATCNGNFSKFDGSQINTSGLAWFPLTAGAAPAKTVPASLFTRPVSFADVALLNAQIGYVGVPGDFGAPPPDGLWAFNLQTGTASKFYDGSGSYVLGGMLIDTQRTRLFVAHANASQPSLEVFNLADPASPSHHVSINPSLTTGLPPRQLAWY